MPARTGIVCEAIATIVKSKIDLFRVVGSAQNEWPTFSDLAWGAFINYVVSGGLEFLLRAKEFLEKNRDVGLGS